MAARARLLSFVLGSGALLGAALCMRGSAPRDAGAPVAPAAQTESASLEPDGSSALVAGESCPARPLQLPTGAPPHVSCRDARRVAAQVRARLAEPATKTDSKSFADLLSGWLDPHGLWSAAPDAPARQTIQSDAQSLLHELEMDPNSDAPCPAALHIARVTRNWVEELRLLYREAAAEAPALTAKPAFRLIAGDVFEDDPVTRPARALARDLGRRAGVLKRAFGAAVSETAALAEARFLPELSEQLWSEVVLAAALRAYVPTLDAHGQWAPLDEEWSLYAADSTAPAEPRLWDHMARSVAGARIIGSAAEPLRDGDIVIGIGDVTTAGLSVEQSEQLSVLEPGGAESERKVSVLRLGQAAPREFRVSVDAHPGELQPVDQPELVPVRVRYGGGHVLVLALDEVPEWLGEELAELVEGLDRGNAPLGIVLDLRGNGGGSTDGAAGALGVFMPDVPSFPLKRRDGGIEVERTLRPAPGAQWAGPLAILVDGYTASAAEMIAGAVESYGRGPVIGSRTFGKGCIQEYFDDRAAAGVLRLTTMVFALPDGSPVQGVGVEPTIPLPLPVPPEREAALPGSFSAWAGPDVRDPRALGGPSWPGHGGRLGRCPDPVVCAALRRIGGGPVRPLPKASRRSPDRLARAPAAKARSRAH